MQQIDNSRSDSLQRGPLDVTWIAYEVNTVRAGTLSTAHLVIQNSGTATWRSRDEGGILVSYHWLDGLRNPIVWDCPRTALSRAIAPGETVEVSIAIRAPVPPGEYLLAFDLLEEFRFWFSEVGVPMLELPATVGPRITERRLGVIVHPGPGDANETHAALDRQLESVVYDEPTAVAHLVAGCVPEPDWSRRLLDAHAEGYAAVGGAIDLPGRRAERRHWSWLGTWQPTAGRNPRFGRPLILPSLVAGLEPTSLNGWPAFSQQSDLPWDRREPMLFDGRIVLRFPQQRDHRQR